MSVNVKHFSRKRNQRRGASTVEFALVFPIIMTFFGAMVVFAQANLLRDTAQHAAYEGARAAIVPGATAKNAMQATKQMMAIVDTRQAEIRITPSVITDDVESVRVDVNIPMGPNLWWMAATPFIPEDWTMTASVELNRETGTAN
jgi:Flp pilus assembly protein TadG